MKTVCVRCDNQVAPFNFFCKQCNENFLNRKRNESYEPQDNSYYEELDEQLRTADQREDETRE